jgi:glycosyltransferase involved in cell wall biosynthesis
MNDSISVIIPSYNSSDTITLTLDSLLNQAPVKADEIIVVDSSDNGKFDSVVSKYRTSVVIKFVRSLEKLTPAKARNIGFGQAAGNLLVFLDSDVVPSPALLSLYIDAYKSGFMAGGGSVKLPEFQRNMLIPTAQYYLQCNEYIPAGEKRVKKFLSGCNFFCERNIFKNVGGFPELRASEDVLLGLALSKITKVWFIPHASVFHIFREDWKSFLSNQRLLGKYVGIYRKRLSNHFLKNRLIMIILFPVFYIAKYFRIIPRIYHAGSYHRYQFLKIIPIFSFGLLCWTLGFIIESRDSNE